MRNKVGTVSHSVKNYLYAIYSLTRYSGEARNAAVASRLGVTRASVNRGVTRLSKFGFVARSESRGFHLTDAGLKIVHESTDKINAITFFLMHTLDIEEQTARSEAYLLEGCLSENIIQSIRKAARL